MPPNPSPTTTPHQLSPRDNNSINATPIVLVPLLCIAIFALIIYYTCKQEREYQEAIRLGHRPPRSVTSANSWDSTGAWVRDVRGATARSDRSKARSKKAGHKKRVARRSETTETVGEKTSGGGEKKKGRERLTTIAEESEADMSHEHRSRSRGRGGKGSRSPRKAELKGGRRASSTTRQL